MPPTFLGPLGVGRGVTRQPQSTRSLALDGVNQYAQAAFTPGAYPGMTFFCWVKLNTAGFYPMVMSYGSNGENSPELRFDASTGHMAWIARGNNSGVLDTASAVGDGWHFWAGAVGLAGVSPQIMELWKDGVSLGTFNMGGSVNITSATPLRLGRRSDNDFYLDAKIDNAGVVPYVLTPTRIAALFSGDDPTTLDYSGGGVLYRFEDQANPTADASGNGHPGTLVGGPTFDTDVAVPLQ